MYFHENDYFPEARVQTIKRLHQGTKKHNVVMIDYRGYGKSEGTPTEEGLYLDVKAIMDHVLSMQEIDNTHVFVFGGSMGGVMATYAAYNYQEHLRGLILQNTICNALSLAESKLWFIKPLLPYIVKFNFPSLERISRLTLPIMFIISINDPLTPSNEMYKLYEEASNTVYRKIYEIYSSDHYFPYLQEEKKYEEMLTNFIDSCNKPGIFGQHIEKFKTLSTDIKVQQNEKVEDL